MSTCQHIMHRKCHVWAAFKTPHILWNPEVHYSPLVWKITNFFKHTPIYTGCPRSNVGDFGRVLLMLNYTDITQNTYIQSWTVTEIMTIEKCGLLGGPRTVRRPWRHTRTLRMPGNETSLANIVMQWPWRVGYKICLMTLGCIMRFLFMWWR